ncbi:MAG: hypothetical protein JXL97_07180 [Bacteroidales bacterium]|nr:hypothetical protein [Bacteroidales bacterium]
MKKILIYLPLILAMMVLSSCKKEDAAKDLQKVIDKINYFNTTFEGFYSDGVISTEKPDDDTPSEYEKLKEIASQYYDMMNKINSNIADEKDDLDDGQTIGEYEQQYIDLLSQRNAEIIEITTLFEDNLSKM